MNQRALGAVFVLAIALGMISVAVHHNPEHPGIRPEAGPSATTAPQTAGPVADQGPIMRKNVPHLDRGMACYRVYEYGILDGMDFRGAGYTARISQSEVRFGTPEQSLVLGAPTFEQGSRSIACSAPQFSHPAFGVARLERGPVTEEYVFENRRMEQLFRIPQPLGQGALKVSVPLLLDFPAVVETVEPKSGSFGPPQLKDGALVVRDPRGNARFTCTSAVVMDAAGARLAIAPRHQNNAIIMEVPESFMAKATYPVVLDPWFTSTSGTINAISNTPTASERPSMKDNVVAWSDNSSGNFEIYLKVWNGSDFVELNGSATGGGVSANAGDSVNPSVVADASGSPTVAWEDTTGGARSIYLKQFPTRGGGQGVGASFQELAGSASALGLSGSFGSNQHPAVGLLAGVVPAEITFDSNGNPITSPATHVVCPVVAWESSAGGIYCSAFYPGAPAIPSLGGAPPLPSVPAGWYQLGSPGGVNVNKDLFNQALVVDGGTGGSYPSLVVDGNNQVTIAWESAASGNFEIYATRWTLNPPPGPGVSTDFKVIAFDTQRFDMKPVADFHGIANAGGLIDQVSNTPTPSEFPSLCLDSVSGFDIAWQETEAFPAGPTATSSQIYLLHNNGAGAWAALGISASPGGISRTGLAYDGAAQTPPVPGNASHPSVASGAGYVAVAWADTSNSRSSIYARRFASVGGGTWDQIGFQGSAFPPRVPLILPPAVPESAPIEGVSQSANFAIQPQIEVDGDSNAFVVWADGSGATFDIQVAEFVPNGPGQAVGVGTSNPGFQLTVRQTLTDPSLPGGATDVPFGDFTQGTSIFLSSRVFTETLNPPGTSLWLQFEIQPAGTAFTLTPNFQSLFVAPDTPPTVLPPPPPTSLAVLKFDGLPNTDYHYITRSIDQIGRVSPWFLQTNVAGVSFRVNSAQAPGGGSNGPSNTGVLTSTTKTRSNCGLLGLEVLGVLGLVRMIRRKRK